MQKWEYFQFSIYNGKYYDSANKELKQWRNKGDDFLNYLGEQGWELVSVSVTGLSTI